MERRTRQHDLDDRITQLDIELCELKRERNALSPISQLPPEVLCKILSCDALTFISDDYKNHQDNPVSPALCFSHVSHAWRAILLGSAQIWSYIRVGKDTKPKHFELMWANTGSALVDLNIDTSTTALPTPSRGTPIAIEALVDTIRQHPAKLHSLRLRLEPEAIRCIFEGWEGSLESLEDLLVSDPTEAWGSKDSTSITQYLACRMPVLRRFWATGYAVSLTSPLLSSVSLKAVRLYQGGGVVEDMIDFIRKRGGNIHTMEMGTDAPSLRDVDATQSTSSQQLPPSTTTCLEYIHLQSANWRTVVEVLSSIRIPSARLKVICRVIPDAKLHDLFTAVAHASGSVLSPQEVMFHCNGDTAFWQHPITHPLVEGVRRVLSANADTEMSQPKTHFGDMGRVPFGNPEDYQVAFSFSSLKVLTVECEIPLGLWAVLAHSTPLEVLRVGRFVDCYAMLDAIGNPGVAPAGSVPFPCLKVFVNLFGAPRSYSRDVVGRVAAGFSTAEVLDDRQYVLELAEVFRARQGYSGQSELLELLEFRAAEGGVDADVLSILRTVAKDVVWDTRPWWVEGFDYERS